MRRSAPTLLAGILATLLAAGPAAAQTHTQTCAARGDFNDSHFHLTNYAQEGLTSQQLLAMMGDRVPRAMLSGLPLQQQWSYRSTGDFAPDYYLETDADLYYYSFTDAHIAMTYRALTPQQQARLDPMITGFNPADMYAADHVRRVLTTFPGVFTGLGEFSIHKEFVSPKIAGDPPSLTDPALDRLLDFAGEVGLVTVLHNDIVMPFTPPENERAYLDELKAELAEHPNTIIIWAHMGLGRIVAPPTQWLAFLEDLLTDPRTANVYFDISWDEAAKYLLRDQRLLNGVADLMNRYPDRFLFGTDTAAPRSAERYYALYNSYQPLWRRLTPAVSANVRLCNYQRLFDTARTRVRSWERANVRGAQQQ